MLTVARAHQSGCFCPSPRKVPNADFRPELLTKNGVLSKVYCRKSRKTGDSDASKSTPKGWAFLAKIGDAVLGVVFLATNTARPAASAMR
jgi:hypothetical protein